MYGCLIAQLWYDNEHAMLFQYFVEAGAIAVRRVRKEDLRHVAKATGATVVCFLASYLNLNCILLLGFPCSVLL